MNAHLKSFDAGANAKNIFSVPSEGTDLSRAVMVRFHFDHRVVLTKERR